MNRTVAYLCLLVLTTGMLHANVGEDAKTIIKRYGKPDRKQVINGGQKMWFRSSKYEITVYLMSRNKKTMSVQEEFRLPSGKFMLKDAAKRVLEGYDEKVKWKVIGTTEHKPSKTKVRAKNTHFEGPNGTFAVYCLNNDGSGLSAEKPLSSYVAFFDATAYADFNDKMGANLRDQINE